jgi:DME family drug/metabolite transporter
VLVNRPAHADTASVACLRLLVGGAALLLISLRGGAGRASAPWRRTTRITTLVGAAGVVVFQLGYFLAVERTGVAVGTIVTIGSGPAFAGLIEAARVRHRPCPAWLIGTAACVGGVSLMGLAGAEVQGDALGMLLAVAAGAGWAVFSSAGKQQIERGVDSTAALAAVFCGGAVAMAPLLAFHSPAWVGTPRGAMVALYLGAVSVGAAYTLYGFALRHLTAASVITLTLLEPLTATVLGVVVVHEGVRPAGLAGALLVAAGLVITARGSLAAAGP